VVRRLRDWRRRFGILPLALLAIAAVLAGSAGVLALRSAPVAQGQGTSGIGDLLALGLGLGQTPTPAPLQDPPEPPIAATPAPTCGPGSHPITGQVDGRVPQSVISTPQAADGWNCNLTEVAHQGTSGGFKVWSYTDTHGHLCAFYDTALLFPTNAVNLFGPSLGVAVLDMSDTAHPVQTATLTSLPMLSPHESLNLNAKRGLLAAVLGNPATYPGLVSIYDVSQDCRHPVLDSTQLVARLGHESGFSPDGNTFWATGTAFPSITAIDVSDPKHPHDLWQGNIVAHGMSVSDDGDRAYVADPTAGQLLILDTSQIQNRVPHPQVTEISRLTWSNATIPQNAYAFTSHGHPFLLEFDEYAYSIGHKAPPDTVGAGRIIDIADETHPRVVSDLRLAVNQPANHKAADGDPGALSPVQGYAAHYCAIPREVDPDIAACSFINSGLRVFDISDPYHPREVAYFVAPPRAADENGAMASDFAMSKPAFDPAQREVWYTDGTSGFYVLRLDTSVWPHPLGVPAPRTCVSPSGRLGGRSLGVLFLGESRRAARRAIDRFSTRGRTYFDFYCLSGGGLRAGFAPHGRLRGRAVLLLTSDRFYAYRGVRPGSSLAAARRRLRVGRGYPVGLNTWYVVRGARGAASGVFKVRNGEVQEVGLATRALTATPALARAFFRSFGH
jgi:hypothetical protein